MGKTKVCRKCSLEKPLEAFHAAPCNKSDGRKGTCKQCTAEARYAKQGGRIRPVSVQRTCATCGNQFTVPPCYIDNGAHKGLYCSNACKGVIVGAISRGKPKSAEQRAKQSTVMKAKPPWRAKLPPIILNCVQCDKWFELPGSEKKKAAKTRFCSTACWYNYIRENPKYSPAWAGGPFLYYGPNWKEQARLARRRDNYTCQDCGKEQRQPALDVHHVIPRRLFGDNYRAGNDLANLISLCKRCHLSRRTSDHNIARLQTLAQMD